jgi:hypothetical protein
MTGLVRPETVYSNAGSVPREQSLVCVSDKL